jgi:hypothetical protein
MDNRNSAEKFERAGAEAAEVLGRFFHLASELGREFNPNRPVHTAPSGEPTAEELRNIGDQLRQFRESAGYTLEGFASALEGQLNHGSVADRINAVERGEAELPVHWARSVASVLKNCEIESLFTHSQQSAATAAAPQGLGRAATLMQVFADDPDLDQLSEADFEKLRAHLESAYLSAKALIKR